MKRILHNIVSLPSRLLSGLVWLYQLVLSPDHSWLAARYPYGYCRHYPSCSEYSRQSLLKHGLIKGLFLSSRRVLKCHPWAEPSVDPVP